MIVERLRMRLFGLPFLAGGITLLAGIVIGCLGFVVYQSVRDSGREHARMGSYGAKAPKVGVRVGSASGLEITEAGGDRSNSALRIGRIRFEAASLGFFRVGFVRVLVLEDVRLRVAVATDAFGPEAPAEALEAALQRLLDRDGLRKAGLGERLAVTTLAPMRIEVVRKERILLIMTADRARLDLAREQMEMMGQVRLAVDDGERKLETPRLSVGLRTQEIWTDDAVVVEGREGRSEELGFRGNIWLRT